jgi:putative ABC transport system permease protein
MAIPIVYNLRSVRARWVSAIVAVLGIAGTVGVFIAMLSLARGFKATVVGSGSAENALIRRAGSTGEIDGSIPLEQVRVIQDAPGIARDGDQPLVSPEVVVIAAFPLKATGTDANVQVRGVSPNALKVRKNIRMVEGRFFQPGLNELIVGKNVPSTYAGLNLGDTIRFGGGNWNVVGIFDAGGSAFDSEVWCDARVLSQVYRRPENIFSSITVRLTSPAALSQLKDSLTADPRMQVQVDREIDYYEKQSRGLTTLITVLGTLVAGVMGIGAIFGALNTMYSAVSERSREIATMRAIGFGAAAIIYFRGAIHFADWRACGLRCRAPAERIHDEHNEHADVFAPRVRVSRDAAASGYRDWIRAADGAGWRRPSGDSCGAPAGGAGFARIVAAE